MPIYKGNNKYDLSGFSSVFWGNNLVWQASSGVTYYPILTDDTNKYPLYLKGWKTKTYNGSEDWLQQSTQKWFSRYEDTLLYQSSNFRGYCDTFPTSTVAAASMPNNSFVPQGYNNRGRMVFQHTDTADITAWKAWLAANPIIVLVPLATSDGSLWFAVTDETNYGYYCPATQVFCKVYGMTGTKIERVEYVTFDGADCYVNSGINLTGADTVTIDFLYDKTGSNIFGSWRPSNTNVYTLYASASKSYTRYESSLYRSAALPINTRLTYRMTPTGNYVDGVQADTWAQADFDSATPCLVGWLNGSGSPHMGGNVYDFSIDNKSHLIPVKIGTTYYLFDCLRWRLPNHAGKFGGGLVIDEPIEFPTLIPEESPPMLMMGRPPIPQPEPEPGPETVPEFEEN